MLARHTGTRVGREATLLSVVRAASLEPRKGEHGAEFLPSFVSVGNATGAVERLTDGRSRIGPTRCERRAAHHRSNEDAGTAMDARRHDHHAAHGACAVHARPAERRRPSDAPDGDELTVEELALIASCGERIRTADWTQIRRAGLDAHRLGKWPFRSRA